MKKFFSFLIILTLVLGTFIVPSYAVADETKPPSSGGSYIVYSSTYVRSYCLDIKGDFYYYESDKKLYFKPSVTSVYNLYSYYIRTTDWVSNGGMVNQNAVSGTSFLLDGPFGGTYSPIPEFKCVSGGKLFIIGTDGNIKSSLSPGVTNSISDGITITSPSNNANITTDTFQVDVTVKVPISSTFQSVIKSAILDTGVGINDNIGQGCYIFAKTSASGSKKYYSMNGGDMGKQGFRKSDITEVTSSYYLVKKSFIIDNAEGGTNVTITAHMPKDNLFVWSNYKTYDASLTIYNDVSKPSDIDGTTGSAITGFTPPSRGNYEDTVFGSLAFSLDWVIYILKLPFELIGKLFSITANGLSSVTGWLNDVIGFMTKLFSFAPAPVVICIGTLMTIATVFAIFRIFRR